MLQQISLEQKLKQYPQWIKFYHLNDETGFLISPNYKLSENFETFEKVLNNLSQLNQNKQIIKIIDSFPQVKYQYTDFNSKVILREGLDYLIHSYIKLKKGQGLNEDQIIIPKSLAKPLYDISKQFDIHCGMATGQCFNWYLQSPQSKEYPKIEEVKLKWHFTEKKQQEKFFFAGTVIGSLTMANVLKQIFQINAYIDLKPDSTNIILNKLNKIQSCIKHINEQNKILIQKLSPQYFYNQLRLYVSGFNNGVLFKGVQNDQDLIVKSSGGNTGYDPSYQIFERSFGIKFTGKLEEAQNKIREKIPKKNRDLIDAMEKDSKIRVYCEKIPELRKAYNNIIRVYSKFFQIHTTMITRFIFKFLSQNDIKQATGTGGQSIKNILERYQAVDTFAFPQPQQSEVKQSMKQQPSCRWQDQEQNKQKEK